jgi:hypothetical protein
VSNKTKNVPGNLQYDAYDDGDNFRSALSCLILKRYKLQKAAANRSGFFFAPQPPKGEFEKGIRDTETSTG